jgi:dTDP-4-amino-4,6-dideoxygalactose transaminase
VLPFVDLQAQRARLGDRVDRAIARVLEHGQFIMGPEVGELEGLLTELSGGFEAIGCSSGTDAIVLVLMALGVGPGDAVFVPSFTFAASAEAVAMVGAVPVFVDVDPDSFNLDAAALAAALDHGVEGARPVGVIAVDLFGRPADYPAIAGVSAGSGLWVIADAAQSLGASLGGTPVGALAAYTTTSFFPAKPLGGYGDGGAVFTSDGEAASTVRSLIAHGKGDHRYEHLRVGMNGRLDTLQASILIEKLAIFGDELKSRQVVADRYAAALDGLVEVPRLPSSTSSSWAQYTILTDDRDGLARRLAADGIPTAVHYPIPLHKQPAYSKFPVGVGGTPVAERLASRVLSIPIHAYLDEPTQDRIIDAIRTFVCESAP